MTVPVQIAPPSSGTITPAGRPSRVRSIGTAVAVATAPALFFSSSAVGQDFGSASATQILVIALAFIATTLPIAGLITAPEPRAVKIRASYFLGGALAAALLVYTFISQSGSYRLGLLSAGVIAYGLAIAAWFVLKQRPTRSFAALPIVLLTAASAFAPSMIVGWIILIIVPVGAAWVGYLASQGDGGAGNAASAQQARIEANAHSIQEWQAAYLLANPGQPVPVLPPGYGVSGIQAPTGQTNTFAILALVFGILGGYLAILFGHLAKHQIKRTGEQGSGLATAGLVLGYAWVGATLAFWAFVAIVALR